MSLAAPLWFWKKSSRFWNLFPKFRIFLKFWKLWVIFSKVGSKFWRWEGYIGPYFDLPWPPFPTRSNFYGSKWRVQDIQMIRWIWNLFNINKTSRQVLGKIFKILKTKPYGALVIFWDKWVPGSWNRFWSSDHISKIGKNYINFDNCNLFFKHLALWSCPNIFGPPTMVFAVFDFKDWAFHVHD